MRDASVPAGVVHGVEHVHKVGGVRVVVAVGAQPHSKGGQQGNALVVEVVDGEV